MSVHYVHFKSKTMTPCGLTREAYEAAKQTWLCTGCCQPRPGVRALDAHIQESKPTGPLNAVASCGLPMAHKSFLLRFGVPRIKRDLYLGDVYGPDGSILPDWATFRGAHGLIVRGCKHVQHRVCTDCGRNLYFAMGKPYLFPKPVEGIELFESDLLGLIVPEPIVMGLGIGKTPGVWVEKLEVLNEAKDCLPSLAFGVDMRGA